MFGKLIFYDLLLGCFISGGREGTVYLWDLQRTIPLRIYSGHESDINQIRFHPNCNYLATASADSAIILWDINQIRQVRMFVGHRAPVTTIQFSACGKYLVSGGEDGSVRLWDISYGKCITELMDDDDGGGLVIRNSNNQTGLYHRNYKKKSIQSIAFGPQDRLLAWCSATVPAAVNIWRNSIYEP